MEVNYKLLGQRIKSRRLELKISQEKLAELTDLSIPHISHIETASTKVSLPSLVAIANALDTTVDNLLCDSILRSKGVFSNEISAIIKDCDDKEIRLIADSIKAIKASYRNLKQFSRE